MMKIAMSPAAAGFLRGLLARGGIGRDRILLTEFRSTDWQSLTFTGERHDIRLRILGPDAGQIVRQLTDGLEDAEFAVPGFIVADVAVTDGPIAGADGSIQLTVEALTVAEN